MGDFIQMSVSLISRDRIRRVGLSLSIFLAFSIMAMPSQAFDWQFWKKDDEQKASDLDKYGFEKQEKSEKQINVLQRLFEERSNLDLAIENTKKKNLKKACEHWTVLS